MRRSSGLGLILLAAACGHPAGGGASSSSAAAAKGSGPAPARSSSAAPAASPGPSASAAPAAPSLTKEAFCDRIGKLGEARLAKCGKNDQNQWTYLDFKPRVESARKTCADVVGAPLVEFHGDVAAACVAAAEKRQGPTTFDTLNGIAACRGLLTGSAPAGTAAKVVEACAAGLTLRGGSCAAPAAANADCTLQGDGAFGERGLHKDCADGFVCGNGKCVKGAIGEPCSPLANGCPQTSTCYQGKCRAFGALGDACMGAFDCGFENRCAISGGVMGKCEPKAELGAKCKEAWDCASDHCRAGTCTTFCGGG